MVEFYFVYVLRSEVTGCRYVGSCADLSVRLVQHNAGASKSYGARHTLDVSAMPNNMKLDRKLCSESGFIKLEKVVKNLIGSNRIA